MIEFVIGAIVAVVAIVLAIVFIRYNLKRVYIFACVKAAFDQQLEAIYAQIECLGTEPSTCAVLARTNRLSGSGGESWAVPVPAYVKPWAGRVITAEGGAHVTFRFCSSEVSEPVLRGKIYRIVRVPRYLTKTGKGRNQFSPEKYLARNPQLLKALASVCPKYPAELLECLLTPGYDGFEFDHGFQVRIGGSPGWVQDPEYPSCDQCKKRMSLILQMPGGLLPAKKLSECTFWFFGCATHPENTKQVEQCT